MATPVHTHRLVPTMWRAARDRGIDAPDWSGTTPPSACRLPPDDYRALLAIRTTGIDLETRPDGIRVHTPRGTVIHLWTGVTVARHTADGTTCDLPCPAPLPGHDAQAEHGGAVFTRGDYLATGWLSAYNAIAPRA